MRSLEPLDPSTRPLMTIEEAAPYVRLGRSAAYAAAASGQLPSVRFGRRIFVSTAALCRLLGLDEVNADRA